MRTTIPATPSRREQRRVRAVERERARRERNRMWTVVPGQDLGLNTNGGPANREG